MSAPQGAVVPLLVDAVSIAPDWIEQETQDRRARFALGFVKYLAWGSIAAGLSIAILWLFNSDYYQFLFVMPPLLLLAAASGLYPVLHRQHRTAMASHLFLLSLLLVLAVATVILNEMVSATTIGFAIFFVTSLVLLGPRASIWMLGLGLTVFTVDIVLLLTVVPDLLVIHLDPTIALVGNLVLGLLAVSVLLLVARQVITDQEAYLAESMVSNRELDRRAIAERAQRQRLEAVVADYTDFVGEVAAGNLAQRLPLDQAAEQSAADDVDLLLVLGQRLNTMTEGLQATVARLHSAAADLGQSTAEILAATGQQVASASEQSAAIGQTSTTVNEVKVIADQAVTRAQEVADASHRTVEVAQTGLHAVRATIDSVARIKDRVEVIADNILALSAQTQQIDTIIATINDLAAQSNMLALNAAVEAARAGEQGKGFAVVAQEVRSLADQSRQATAQVRAILHQIQAATNATVMATEEGTKGADEGVQLASQTGHAIEQLATVIDESAQAAVQMVAGGQQQSTGIEQVALAMHNINQATTQSLASTRQAEQAARDLDTLARDMKAAVEHYTL